VIKPPNTRRKPVPVALCPPEIPHGLAWYLNRAYAVNCNRL